MIKSKSGALFIDERDKESWEKLETDIITNNKEFKIFTSNQWTWLNNRVPSIINKARKQI